MRSVLRERFVIPHPLRFQKEREVNEIHLSANFKEALRITLPFGAYMAEFQPQNNETLSKRGMHRIRID